MEMYSADTISAVELFDKKIRENAVEITKRLANKIESAEKLIDIQCNIVSYFMGWWVSGTSFAYRGHPVDFQPLLLSSFHKNIFSLFSALRLTSCGLYGAARPLIRNIFESLMIAKFSCTSDNPSVIKKWKNEETIYFSNSILKKIKVPPPEEFYNFWSAICGFSHETRFSLQISLDIYDKDIFKDIDNNITLINVLLECNYHLLNTLLITKEYERWGKFYQGPRFPEQREYKVSELRNVARSLFKSNRKFIGAALVKLISAYKRKWVLSL